METKTFISLDEALKNGNNGQNQEIKGKLIAREVYCNVGPMVESILKHEYQNYGDALFTWDDVSNVYSYPEWSDTVLGETLTFDGGNQEAYEEFQNEFERLKDESLELLNSEEISEETHERNLDGTG